MIQPPKYAKIGGTAMRLIDNRRYWRDAGIWGIDVRLKNGKFYASPKNNEYLEHIRGEEVKEISEAEWKKSNEGCV
jgi:hypothetical protein